MPATEEIESRALEADKPRSEVRAEPYPLPAGFEWCSIDVRASHELRELFELLSDNYVEGAITMTTSWVLRAPG